jgi:hypothetical protein
MTPAPYSVTLQWGTVPLAGRTGYYVTLNGTRVSDQTSSPYTFNQLVANTTYTLGVQAHDGSSGVSQVYTTTYTTPALPGGPVLLPLADPTFVVNSQPSGGDNTTSTPNYTANFDVCDAGLPVGVKISRLLNNSIGIQSCALDSTNVYHLDATSIARIPISATNFFGDGSPTWSDWSGEQYTTLSTSAPYLIGLAVSGGSLYAVDPNGALLTNNLPPSTTRIVPVSTTWTGGASPFTASTGTPWNVPFCRQIAFDRQGMLWALQQASIAASRAAVLSRWTTTGTLLQSTTLATNIYPMDITCDPNSDTVLIADNGQDQNFKKYSYDSANVNPMAPTTGGPIPGSSTIGIQKGYLDTTQGVPGTLGPLRFVNPRAIAVDASGNVLIGQSGTPGAGDDSWTTGPCAFVSLLNSSGVEQWRNWGGAFGGTGEPSDDGTMFFERQLSFVRSNTDINGAKIYRGQAGDASWLGVNSQYLPYAYTADPWTYAGIEDRAADNSGTPQGVGAGGGTGVMSVTASNGSTYLFQNGGLNDQTTGFYYRVYQIQPGQAIAIPRTVIGPTGIWRNGTQTFSYGNLGPAEGPWFVQPNMDVWMVGSGQLFRYRFQGFDGVGTPLYDPTHRDTYSAPAELSTRVAILRAYGATAGGTVYVAGFGPGQTYPPIAGDSETRFMTICRYDNVPASGGAFPAATWSYVPSFTVVSGLGHLPFSFCASPADNRVIIGWQQGTLGGSTGAELEFLVDTTSSSGPTHSSFYQLPGPVQWGISGVFDLMCSTQAKNGYVWCEDDECSKVIGKAIAGT